MTTPSSSPPHNYTPRFTSSQSTSRNGRGITRCTKMAIHCMNGMKHPYDVDPNTGKVVRKHQTVLSTYLGTCAREKISILYAKWKDVPKSVKNQIWKDVLRKFDIENTKEMRKKILSSVSAKWRHHKTCLTNKAISEPDDEDTCVRYNIPLEDWEKFKSIRNDPSWATIRKKAQESQKMNTTPHAMSRGGYALLEERVMEEKLKKRQTEAAQSGDESEVDPSSLPRHLKWKLARIKKTGSMTSEAAKKIVERIDMLEEQCKEGTIILEGRNDILTTAIGKPEHPGRVRGTEAGVGIRQYFGPLTRGPATSSSISPEVLQRLTQKITQDVTQELMKQFGSVLQSVNSQPPEVEDDTTPITRNSTINSQSPQPPVVEDDATPIIHNSRNVSCAVAATTNPSWETISADMSDRVMLYVKADPLRLVAIGRVHQWGSTQHGLDELVRVAVEVLDNVAPVSDELVRVAVEVVLDPVAPVPAPNEEVKLVGQAIGGFIVWPRHLLKVFSPKDTQRSEKQVPVVDRQKDTQRSEKQVPVVDRRKDTQRSEKQVPVVDRQKDTQRSEKQVPVVDRKKMKPVQQPVNSSKSIENPILELFNVLPTLQQNPLQVSWEVTVFGTKNDMPLSISHINVLEIYTGNMWLSLSTIQFWIMFCNKLSEDANNGKVYGFLEPQHIQKSGKKQEITKYMLTHLKESKKQIYLAPYYNEQHWQLLVLVPKENVAVWFCSVGKKPEKDIKQIVQDFFKGCQNIGSKRTRKSKPIINWIEPQCNQQSGGWEGGYYVMHWMSTIIQFSIKTNWKQLFRDTGELSKEVIERIRVQWAKYLLEFRNSI